MPDNIAISQQWSISQAILLPVKQQCRQSDSIVESQVAFQTVK